MLAEIKDARELRRALKALKILTPKKKKNKRGPSNWWHGVAIVARRGAIEVRAGAPINMCDEGQGSIVIEAEVRAMGSVVVCLRTLETMLIRMGRSKRPLLIKRLGANVGGLFTSGGIRFALNGPESEEYMDGDSYAAWHYVGLLQEDYSFRVAGAGLLSAMDLCRKYASTNDSRVNLCGINMEPEGGMDTGKPGGPARFTATDGHRLTTAVRGLLAEEHEETDAAGLVGFLEHSTITPQKAARFMLEAFGEDDVLTIRVGTSTPSPVGDGGTTIEMSNGKGTALLYKPINGSFPDFTTKMPEGGATVITVGRLDLLRAIHRAHAISGRQKGHVKLESLNAYAPEKDQLLIVEVTARELTDRYNEQLSAEITDTRSEEQQERRQEAGKVGEVKAGFNPKYLKHVLKDMKGEFVEVEITDTLTPALFKDPDAEETLFLVMPCRL